MLANKQRILDLSSAMKRSLINQLAENSIRGYTYTCSFTSFKDLIKDTSET